MSNTTHATGISLGCALAMILSWSVNKAVGWAFLHGLCSWFYVIYFYFTHYNK